MPDWNDDDDAQTSPTIGPGTNFTWVAVGSLLAGLALVLGAFYSIKADVSSIKTTLGSIDGRKLSRAEFARWTRDHQRENLANGVKVEVYVPPPDRGDGGEDR